MQLSSFFLLPSPKEMSLPLFVVIVSVEGTSERLVRYRAQTSPSRHTLSHPPKELLVNFGRRTCNIFHLLILCHISPSPTHLTWQICLLQVGFWSIDSQQRFFANCFIYNFMSVQQQSTQVGEISHHPSNNSEKSSTAYCVHGQDNISGRVH